MNIRGSLYEYSPIPHMSFWRSPHEYLWIEAWVFVVPHMSFWRSSYEYLLSLHEYSRKPGLEEMAYCWIYLCGATVFESLDSCHQQPANDKRVKTLPTHLQSLKGVISIHTRQCDLHTYQTVWSMCVPDNVIYIHTRQCDLYAYQPVWSLCIPTSVISMHTR